mgnify:CR=1 FL=1
MNYYLQTLDKNLVNDLIGSKVLEIRGKAIHKELMNDIINDEEIEDESLEFWINWNYMANRRGEHQWLGDADELFDEDYNPIYMPLYPEYVMNNR